MVLLQSTLPQAFRDVQYRFFQGGGLPLFLQMDSAEAGLACLAMVIRQAGAQHTLESLRKRFEVSSRGTSIANLQAWADQLGFTSRALALTAAEVSEFKLPLLLQWQAEHWVVLKRITNKAWLINDPAVGERWISNAQAQRQFAGFALEITPRQLRLARTTAQPKLNLSELWQSFPGLGTAVLKLIGVSLVLEAIALLTPYYTQIVMDHVLVTGDADLLQIIALATAFLLLFQSVFTAVRGWAGLLLSQSMGCQIYAHVIRHLLCLPIGFFMRRSTGDLVSRFNSLGQLNQSLTRTSIEIALDAVISIGTLGMMFLYSPALALIALGVFGLMLFGKAIIFNSSQRIVAEKTHLEAKRQSHLIESLRAIHAVKMAGADPTRAQQWSELTQKIAEKEVATERINLSSQWVLSTCAGLAHTLVIFLAAQKILANQMSVGMLFAFLAYQGNFTARASAFVDRMMWLRSMQVHWGRVGDIIFSEPEKPSDNTRTKNHTAALGAASLLSVQDLGYRYSQSDALIFEGLSFEVKPAQMLAIVGPSGCGKTTLLCVLGGIFLPVQGRLAYDRVAVRADNHVQMRERVAFVFQNDELFEGSIADNICFFSAAPRPEHMTFCAAMACIASDIEGMPAGYRTRLAEQGAGLSGGQRQRILLARALYRNPSLLILDEATSHLDVATEKQVLQNLKRLGMTVVMSAHRPDAIAMADHLFAMREKTWTENEA